MQAWKFFGTLKSEFVYLKNLNLEWGRENITLRQALSKKAEA
jgi:hypothetical protein